MKLRILMVAVACLFSLSAFALPDYPWYSEYFDEEGNSVGYRTMNCLGQFNTVGTVTENFTTEFGEPCHTEVELYTCTDFDLVAFTGTYFPMCFSPGYAFWCENNSEDCPY